MKCEIKIVIILVALSTAIRTKYMLVAIEDDGLEKLEHAIVRGKDHVFGQYYLVFVQC